MGQSGTMGINPAGWLVPLLGRRAGHENAGLGFCASCGIWRSSTTTGRCVVGSCWHPRHVRIGSWPRVRTGSDSQRTVLRRRRIRACGASPKTALGEIDVFGDRHGGEQHADYSTGSADVSLFGWVEGVAFVDAGNMFPKVRDFCAHGSRGGRRRRPPHQLAVCAASESISACR